MTRRLNDSTREALEGEVVNLEYDKTRIDAQIEAIRNLLAHDRPIPATAPAEGFFARSDDGHYHPDPAPSCPHGHPPGSARDCACHEEP